MNRDHELIETLASSERFALHRGRRAASGAPMLVRAARQAPPAAADAAALRAECELIAGLSCATLLQPRLIELPSGLALSMEDPGGELLSALVARGRLEVGIALGVGIALAEALAELHRRGWLHNGIRPEAVLCEAATARAWIIEFCDARSAAAPRRSLAPALNNAARLVHASPEQTGRMEGAIDARSDLYALGVLLYEALVGAPPFKSDDALELIHAHIARLAVAPCDIDARAPRPLSDIVMKLLAKSPDERYQSAMGLAADLTECARQWSAHGRIEPFALGRRDARERLAISRELYGRERELEALLAAFERACIEPSGRPAMLLVSGYAGIGKTSLIQALVRPIAARQGYFVSGKFDQVVRGIPFGALIQALRTLVRQLLTESETRLDAWRGQLSQALGASGGVLVEVIPELEFILGKQPPAVQLGRAEALNRFQRVFRNFIAALAQPAHPLVVFLDDLQWADAATLGLLEPLLAGSDSRGLFVIGACRDTELEGAHRLTRTLSALEAAGVGVQRLTLGPLGLPDLGALVRDALRCSRDDAEPLARLAFEKTAGNPFFVIQFLKTLERDGHFRYDSEAGCWTYRIEAIADAPLADNVIELMTENIRRLAVKSQYALTLAACIGGVFDARTLAVVSEQSEASAADDLRQAIEHGLIQRAERRHGAAADEPARALPAYAFVHDRVQQAAYALIPAGRKPMLHLTIGRLLRSRAGGAAEAEHDLFDVVHHLNLGRSLIADDAERLEVARLDLAAGQRAKSSTAYDAALEYLLAGTSLLAEAHWRTHYELAFALHFESAESLYLCGRFDEAEARHALLLEHAASAVDRARVYRLRSVQLENRSRYAEALASAREALQLFGVALPQAAPEKEAALEREIEAIALLIGEREIAALVDLPDMTDAALCIVMNALTDIWSSAYILGDPTLARLISATMVRLSLEHGNVAESAYGYVTHAITVGPVRGDYAAAYEFGLLALAVNQRFDDLRRRAKIYQQFHAHVNFWRQPLATCARYAREACRAGLESGDFLYAAYGAGTEPWSAFAATQDLAHFVRDHEPNVALIRRLKNTGFADSVQILVNWARALQGRGAQAMSLSGGGIDEDAYVRSYCDNAFFATIHGVAKLHLSCLLGTPAQALQAAQAAGAAVPVLLGTVWPVYYEFWNAMAYAAQCADEASAERNAALPVLQAARATFDVLAESCPENFRCQALLLGAEIERIEGGEQRARELYARAIEYGARPGMIQQLALAHELAARFERACGRKVEAARLMAEARAGYARFGAAAKVEQLERMHPDLLPCEAGQVEPDLAAASALDGDGGALDLFSVVKAAQAIAGELDTERLLDRLLSIAIENAGAERGCLVLEFDGASMVYAADPTAAAPPRGVPLAESRALPQSIVNYVRRTAQSVLLADAAADERYANDDYVAAHRPRSVLCLPVQSLGRRVGVLYLENRSVRGAFGAQAARVMQVLATQAAVSLANARLVEGLKREICEREQAQAQVERLKEELETENSYLRRDLIANVSHDLRTPLVSMRGYLEMLSLKGESLAPATRRSYLEIALRQSEHLATLIDELFELAKLDFKGLTLEREPFHLGELAFDVVQKFRLAAEGKQIALGVEAPQGMVPVHADLSLVERVFDNLIGNALQHTGAGGRVSVRLRAEGLQVTAQIEDTGNGIAAADLPFVFDRFYRADRSRSAGGAGLGLAIARRIVELHGGGITVESEPHKGSCFAFSLPAYVAVAA